MKKQITAWERVMSAREARRPKSLDYIQTIFDDFIELHGDRCFGDDSSFVCGIAYLNGKPVTVIRRAKRKNNQRKYEKKFWDAKSRRI